MTRPDHAEAAVDLSALAGDIVAIARIPAPTFAEEARLAWIERRLAGAPGSVRRDGAGNVLWTWGDGRPGLVLAAHVDTVFGLETPHTAARDGPRLVGPGVGDNAAAVALAVAVVEELLGRGPLAPGAVAFTVGEEGLGNLRGATAVCRDLRPEALIALEGHGLESVVTDAVGSVRARVAVRGPGGHPWSDRGRPSAIHSLLELGASLAALARPDAPVNVGLITGGRSVNTIAEEAELLVEARSVHEPPLDAFLGELERLEAPPPLAVSVELLGRRPGGRLSRTEPLLEVVRDVRRGLGLADTLAEGSTDANAALALGIPALALGAATGRDMHTSRESIDVDSLALGRLQLEGVLLRLLG